MQNNLELDFKIKEMARRIRELREIENISTEQMAEKTGVSVEEYLECEQGNKDLNFAFIYRCALALSVFFNTPLSCLFLIKLLAFGTCQVPFFVLQFVIVILFGHITWFLQE